jgi:hypothetical protein
MRPFEIPFGYLLAVHMQDLVCENTDLTIAAEEKAKEAARLEEESQRNADAFDASLGFFGCAFWGLEKKPNSGACQAKTVK